MPLHQPRRLHRSTRRGRNVHEEGSVPAPLKAHRRTVLRRRPRPAVVRGRRVAGSPPWRTGRPARRRNASAFPPSVPFMKSSRPHTSSIVTPARGGLGFSRITNLNWLVPSPHEAGHAGLPWLGNLKRRTGDHRCQHHSSRRNGRAHQRASPAGPGAGFEAWTDGTTTTWAASYGTLAAGDAEEPLPRSAAQRNLKASARHHRRSRPAVPVRHMLLGLGELFLGPTFPSEEPRSPCGSAFPFLPGHDRGLRMGRQPSAVARRGSEGWIRA